jgi:serine/threonine protein kinase
VRCDVYGLGATLYTALTGTIPWAGLDPLQSYERKLVGDLPSVKQLVPILSVRVESVVRRAMEVKPERRFVSCAEFLSAIEGRERAARPLPIEEAPTRDEVDLGSEPPKQPAPPVQDAEQVAWFVRYFDATGERRQVKLRAEEIRQGIRSGRLADDMRVSRSEQGPWLHLSAFNEFVGVVAQLRHSTQQQSEMKSDIERTVEALRAGAPLRRRERNWLPLIVGGLAAAALLGLAAWLLNR